MKASDEIGRSRVQWIVNQAIDRVNELLLEESAIPKDEATMLLGDGATLDSMGFVNFVVALEELLSTDLGLAVNVVGELNSPQRVGTRPNTIGEFVDFLLNLARSKSER